uniref:Putative secreted protein n=1 Tax=Rhipicephalus microplus TaxID=6941 RepID=A0A6M2D960_RHIMP
MCSLESLVVLVLTVPVHVVGRLALWTQLMLDVFHGRLHTLHFLVQHAHSLRHDTLRLASSFSMRFVGPNGSFQSRLHVGHSLLQGRFELVELPSNLFVLLGILFDDSERLFESFLGFSDGGPQLFLGV